jgi:hypothetical protein
MEVDTTHAAAECGVPLETFISWMNDSGLLLVIPGTEDPMCQKWGTPPMVWHVPECGCRFVAGPHSDIQETP